MSLFGTFEPGLAAYLRYCAVFLVRYFGIAGTIYAVLYVGLRTRATRWRIQPGFPGRAEIRHEIWWSMTCMVCTGMTTMLLYALVRDGHTRMYFDVARHGRAYFAFSVLLGLVVYDAWFYWQHRLLHTPWWFRHVHAVHHRITNPTPFANFCLHPVETVMGAACFIVFVVVVPVHPLALALVSMAIFGWGMIAHLGYEFYPRGFTRHRVARWLNTATFHNMHHRRVGTNYGSIFNVWDRLMGTDDPAYQRTFDAVAARVEPARP